MFGSETNYHSKVNSLINEEEKLNSVVGVQMNTK